MSKSGDPTSGLIQGSGDPTLSSALVDELDLYDFLKDEEIDQLCDQNPFEDENDFDIFDRINRDSGPIDDGIAIKYEISPPSDSGNGSLSSDGSSTLSMSPESTSQYLDSPRQESIEVKQAPTAAYVIETKHSLTNPKRRISVREKKPSSKLHHETRKRPRNPIEKAEKIPKLEVLDEQLAAAATSVAHSPSKESGGSIDLTSEEQEVLSQNGWDPTEKNLKKARRKIKNKISAQESRRRKRDYLSNLEERLSNYSTENNQLKKELEKEQADKKSLLCQLRELQQVVNQRFQGKNVKTATTQTSAAVMVVLLCMTIFKGSWSTQDEDDAMLHGQSVMEDFDYTTPPYKSRVLKCFSEDDMDFCNVDGKNLPMIKFDEDEDNDLQYLQLQMAKLDVIDTAEYKQGTLISIAQSVLNNNPEKNASEASGPPIGIPNLAS